MITNRRDFVSITHIPSGISVRADACRSMVRARTACVAMLRGKLWSLERAAEKEPISDAMHVIADRIFARAGVKVPE